MIQIYTDDTLTYDSRLEEYDLLDLKTTTGVSVGGSATITMPPRHPAYNSYRSFKSIVEIYKDRILIFRGRALYPKDDFLGRRTIVCEGERCFLRDAVSRPYEYQDTPANIFAAVLEVYNSQVQSDKQFVIGTITVTDPNDYVRLYTETAEQVSDTIDKLVERCGGYIVFTTDNQGRRAINWYAELGYQSSQAITFGDNLLDFTRSANTDIATRIIPYGAKDEETGARVTIESVNDGIDYVEDSEAIALRGVISKVVCWDDVTLASNLKAKALQYLAASKLIVTSLTVSAVDLASAGLSVDQFRAGDLIHIISPPHGLDTWMLLETLTLDLLNPAGSTISLGQSYASLTGADVAADRESRSDMQQIEQSIRSDYQTDIAKTTESMSSMIQQTSESIMSEVADTYVTNGDLVGEVSTQVTQTKNQILFQFNSLSQTVSDNDAEARAQFKKIEKYIRFIDGDIVLGEEGNAITLKIENDRISFLADGAEVAYFSNRRLYVTDGEFLNSLRLGRFAFMPRANGNLSFVKVY